MSYNHGLKVLNVLLHIILSKIMYVCVLNKQYLFISPLFHPSKILNFFMFSTSWIYICIIIGGLELQH